MKPRRQRDYTRSYNRTSEKEQGDGRTFLIVVEGEGTERLYFEGLRGRLDLKSARVEVLHAGATDPANMLAHAIKLRNERAALAARSAIHVPYDEVWIVLDREAKHHPRGKQLKTALPAAQAADVSIALSDPAFEFWLILHYKHTTAHLPSADAARRALKKHLPAYEKSQLDLRDLLSKLPAAVKNAEACLRHHESCGGDGNPSTQAHLLAVLLNASAAPAFRLM